MRLHNRQPDFSQLLKVLRREKPDRPTLFEFFLNDALYDYLTQGQSFDDDDGFGVLRRDMTAYANAGYDFARLGSSPFGFPNQIVPQMRSHSLNDYASIRNRADFENYPWPDPRDDEDGRLDILARELPEGMKFIVSGPCGILENAIQLVGYDDLCLMQFEDPELLSDIYRAIAERIGAYYRLSLEHPAVGAFIINDDWGFQQQTMVSPDELRRHVFPHNKKLIEAMHAAGKPVILHSCGNLREVMTDIVDDMRFDGKHSYEDNIQPVEEAYEEYGSCIAVIGGFDLDFICRSEPDAIRRRVAAMLRRTESRGGFAVGTGNSVPDYVPRENYLAMIDCVAG